MRPGEIHSRSRFRMADALTDHVYVAGRQRSTYWMVNYKLWEEDGVPINRISMIRANMGCASAPITDVDYVGKRHAVVRAQGAIRPTLIMRRKGIVGEACCFLVDAYIDGRGLGHATITVTLPDGSIWHTQPDVGHSMISILAPAPAVLRQLAVPALRVMEGGLAA